MRRFPVQFDVTTALFPLRWTRVCGHNMGPPDATGLSPEPWVAIGSRVPSTVVLAGDGSGEMGWPGAPLVLSRCVAFLLTQRAACHRLPELLISGERVTCQTSGCSVLSSGFCVFPLLTWLVFWRGNLETGRAQQ